MARKHNYEPQPDYGLHIDYELEKVNAKIRAEVARTTIRKPGESTKRRKHRDAYGRIV